MIDELEDTSVRLKTVTSTEFQNRDRKFMDDAGRGPVFITKHKRPTRVLIDIEEYTRLIARLKSSRVIISVGCDSPSLSKKMENDHAMDQYHSR